MLSIQLIREQPDQVRTGLRRRNWSDTGIVDDVLRCDKRRREALTKVQELRAEANAASRSIGMLMRNGQKEEAQLQIKRQSEAKDEARALEEESRALDNELARLLLAIPNIPAPEVPDGKASLDNQVLAGGNAKPTTSATGTPHWDIAQRLGIVDFDRGAKVSGSGFPFYRGKGARLQRALIQYLLNTAVEAGYTEIQPPLLVNAESARGTGQLPNKEGQMYVVPSDDLYLVPTAEVPLTNMFRDEILEEKALPIRLCGYTPCWRREAGSYGKDVRGLNRLHQFDKVELVHITHPQHSVQEWEFLCKHSEGLLKALGLPFRKLYMCTGDMGFNQASQYDLEVWSSGQGRWLEVASVSNFTDYQARRMRLRYRPRDGGKPALAHTINGSALALPRVVAALLENNLESDGTVLLPAILHHYTGFERID